MFLFLFAAYQKLFGGNVEFCFVCNVSAYHIYIYEVLFGKLQCVCINIFLLFRKSIRRKIFSFPKKANAHFATNVLAQATRSLVRTIRMRVGIDANLYESCFDSPCCFMFKQGWELMRVERREFVYFV